MFSAAWKMLKDTVLAFINDEALSRGAAIAFYKVGNLDEVTGKYPAVAADLRAIAASVQHVAPTGVGPR